MAHWVVMKHKTAYKALQHGLKTCFYVDAVLSLTPMGASPGRPLHGPSSLYADSASESYRLFGRADRQVGRRGGRPDSAFSSCGGPLGSVARHQSARRSGTRGGSGGR